MSSILQEKKTMPLANWNRALWFSKFRSARKH